MVIDVSGVREGELFVTQVLRGNKKMKEMLESQTLCLLIRVLLLLLFFRPHTSSPSHPVLILFSSLPLFLLSFRAVSVGEKKKVYIEGERERSLAQDREEARETFDEKDFVHFDTSSVLFQEEKSPLSQT